MKKISVLGCPGGGKSTFSRALSSKLGIPLIHLDMLYHKPDRTVTPREEFDRLLSDAMNGDAWILDGNYNRTMERRIAASDTVFLVDLPVEACIAGAQSRIGIKRSDLPWVEDSLDETFRQWILDFPRDQLPRIYALLETYREGRNIIVFHSHEEMDVFLKQLG